MVVVTSIVLVDNVRFGGAVRLESFAYDVALSIRQAQLYGISVARFGASFSSGFGVHFDIMSPTEYVMFADVVTPADWRYNNGGNPDEKVQSSAMSGGFFIKKICATSSTGETCSDQNGGPQTLDIFFIRPDPDAHISRGGGDSCISNASACQSAARIQLQSPRGNKMDVTIDASGQISVGRLLN